MTVRLVARQVLRESVRNRDFPTVVAAISTLFCVGGGLAGYLVPRSELLDFSHVLLGAAVVAVPFFGLQLGYQTVGRRREDGRLRLLLAQPISRSTFVAGSYAGKLVVLAVAIVFGVGGALVGHAITGDVVVPEFLTRFALATLLLGAAYVGISVGLSAAFRTTRWADGALLLVFLLSLGPWRILPHAAFVASKGIATREIVLPATFPAWVDLVAGLSPTVAFERLLGFHGMYVFTAEQYTSTQFSIAVLLCWALLAPALGIWRFGRTDL